MSAATELPAKLEVVIEVPRFGFVKRASDGRVDFVSPLPSPFNYGSVPGSTAPDGEPVDALVMGARLPRGTRKHVPVRGYVRFVDAGVEDTKWVCAEAPLSRLDRAQLDAFFTLYAFAKRVVGLASLEGGATRYDGFVER